MTSTFELPRDFVSAAHGAILGHLKERGAASDLVPSREDLAATLQIALWASVLRVEDRPVKFVINLRPLGSTRAIPLRSSIELSASQLAALSTATLPGVSAVHVGRGEQRLEILGIDTLQVEPSAVQIEVQGAATVAIKAGSATVAFISGREAEILDPEVYSRNLFVDRVSPTDDNDYSDREQRFRDIARAMHGQVRGGTLLVLSCSAAGRPLSDLSEALEAHHELERPFDGLREIDAEESDLLLSLQAAASGSEARSLLLRLRAAELSHSQYLAGVVRTTALDGAAVVSCDGALQAFGCKIRLTNTPQIRRTRPTVAPVQCVKLTDFGGTRHQSAARFVGRHPGTRAIICSQDGTISILNHLGADLVDCLEHAEWTF